MTLALAAFLVSAFVPAVQAELAPTGPTPADQNPLMRTVESVTSAAEPKLERGIQDSPFQARGSANPLHAFAEKLGPEMTAEEALPLVRHLMSAYAAGAAAADDDQGKGAPSFSFQDYRPACDINRDGKNDMFDTGWGDWYRGNSHTYTRGISGDNGRIVWQVDNGPYMPANIVADGLPLPEYFKPTNWDPAETDVDGDGICDVMVLGTDGGELLLPATPWLIYAQFNFHISMLSGATGREIWRDDYHLKILLIFPRNPICGDAVMRFENIPTAMDHFQTDVGPRYVLQLTNWTIVIAHYGCPTNQALVRHVVQQNISVFNSSTDHRLWSRAIVYPHPTFTYLRGESDMMGEGEHGPEKEIVLDRYDAGTGYCTLKALRGRDGGDFWELPYDDTQAQRGAFANFEEERELKVWCLSYLRPDMTGDGIEDVIGTFFTKVFGISTTLNGAWRMHIVPIHGHNGKKMWQKDIRTQGWGYAHPLDVRSAPRADPAPFLFVGTVDPPPILASDPRNAPGGRFPHEGIHMNVLNLTSGSPLGFFEEDYALDTYLIWDLALAQHWDPTLELINDDVVLDPLTPAIYMKPSGAIQVLLSTQQHSYFSLDGTSADEVSKFIAWSGQGQVVNCHNDDGTATVISGHSRRLDVTRFDIQTGQTLWRRPIYNSTLWRSMTRGGEIIFLSAICQDTPDGRTMFAFNMNGFDPRYGQNIISLHGYVGNDSLDWVLPELNGRPPLESSLKIDFLLYAPEKEPSVGQKYFMAFTPVVPGLAVGLGLSMAVNRSVRRRNQK